MSVSVIPLPVYKRQSCTCSSCVSACHARPGMLLPIDLQRLSCDQLQDGNEERLPANLLQWAEAHLVAPPGVILAIRDRANNEMLRFEVPVLLPRPSAIAEDGASRCHWLTEDDRCSVHEQAPYGCAWFNTCAPPGSPSDRASSWHLSTACLVLYNMLVIRGERPTIAAAAADVEIPFTVWDHAYYDVHRHLVELGKVLHRKGERPRQ